MSASGRARTAFEKVFGKAPEGVAFAPGRVNLIGEHVDYNNGLVLPMPLALGTLVAWARGEDAIEVVAADFGERDRFRPDEADLHRTVDWRSYVRGMAALWPGEIGGLKLAIAGDLPRGSGLSSSASLCIAIGRALEQATGQQLDASEMARLAQRVEHNFAGVNCGIMDQMAIAAGKPGHALLLDCRDLSHRAHGIPTDWAVLIVDSGVTRGLVDGEYNSRREQCEAAARSLGVASLRDASVEDLRHAELNAAVAARGRHVIEEIARVSDAVEAMAAGDIEWFGTLLKESHASLRDLFEVSHPVVDELVERMQTLIGSEGGARMTGAGFGGSVVAVVQQARAGTIEDIFGASARRVV